MTNIYFSYMVRSKQSQWNQNNYFPGHGKRIDHIVSLRGVQSDYWVDFGSSASGRFKIESSDKYQVVMSI